ncbi:MAG: endonuclease [Segetibacter sp.]|nr:endonuclease [Segetibacter sp.]
MIIKKVVRSVIGIVIIVTSVALFAAAAAPFIDPSGFDWPAFFGLMYPFLLLLHLLVFVCYVFVKRNKQTLLFLIPALCTLNIFLNSFGLNYFKSAAASEGGNTLKFMTYNVHSFKTANDLTQSAQAPILQLIRNEQPEILCVQDFSTERANNTMDSIKTILQTVNFYRGPADPKLFPTNSIATFSKYPIVDTGFIVLSKISKSNQALFTDINKNGKIIRVYNVHFESLGFQPHEYEEWRNADIIGKLEFLFKVKDKFSVAFSNRSEQVKLLKKHTRTCPYPFIIAGDFNDTPSSFAVNYTMSGMKNAFREKGRGYTVTFNGGLPDFQIDYIMANPFFKILSYNVIRQKLSDHYPVVVNLGY